MRYWIKETTSTQGALKIQELVLLRGPEDPVELMMCRKEGGKVLHSLHWTPIAEGSLQTMKLAGESFREATEEEASMVAFEATA